MIVYQNFEQHFEWDPREATTNLATYGVSFKEAATVFADENVAITEDVDSDQLYAKGSSARGRMLIVLHQRGPRIRIFGAMAQQGDAKNADARALGAATKRGAKDETETAATEPGQAAAHDTTSAEDGAAQAIEAEADDMDARAAEPGASRSANEMEASVMEAPAPTDIEKAAGAEAIGEAADKPEVEETRAAEIREPEPATRPAVAETPAAGAIPGDAVVETVASVVETVGPVVETVGPVVEAKETPAPEAPARPRRRIVPYRPRTEEASTPAPESKPDAALAAAKAIPAPAAALPARRRRQPRRVPRDQAIAPLPALVDRNPFVKAVAKPAAEPKVEAAPEPAAEALRRPGRPRAEAAKDKAQLPLAFPRTEESKTAGAAKGAPSGNRIPGAGMTADEYGVYWDAYSAARDEAKRQGKNLKEAQRIGREAGDRAVARGAPAKAPPAKAPKSAPEPATKPTAPKAPEPAATKPAAKKVLSWRAAARAVK